MTSGTYNGERWSENRSAALSRDDGRCQDCGSEEDLHVHHIIPVREFNDPTDAHYLDNLVTLCKYCHPKWENRDGKPVLLDEDEILVNETVDSVSVDTLMDSTKYHDLSSVFEDYISKDSGVCDSCFAEVQTYFPPPEEVHRQSLRHVQSGEGDHILRGETFLAPDGEYCYPPSKDGSANESGKMICKNCGIVDYIPDARSKGDFIKLAHRIRQRLLEKGFGINDDAFYGTIRSLKSEPEMNGREEYIFSKATERGIRAAWEIRGHPYPEEEVEKGEYLDEL